MVYGGVVNESTTVCMYNNCLSVSSTVIQSGGTIVSQSAKINIIMLFSVNETSHHMNSPVFTIHHRSGRANELAIDGSDRERIEYLLEYDMISLSIN